MCQAQDVLCFSDFFEIRIWGDKDVCGKRMRRWGEKRERNSNTRRLCLQLAVLALNLLGRCFADAKVPNQKTILLQCPLARGHVELLYLELQLTYLRLSCGVSKCAVSQRMHTWLVYVSHLVGQGLLRGRLLRDRLRSLDRGQQSPAFLFVRGCCYGISPRPFVYLFHCQTRWPGKSTKWRFPGISHARPTRRCETVPAWNAGRLTSAQIL